MLALLLASTSWGFDGNRKGFVLGGGLGIALVASWDEGTVDESKAGIAVNLYLGYAWDEFNMIVAEGNVAAYDSDFGDVFSQGFDGAAWYHYFGPKGKSWYSTLGLGTYSFTWDTGNNSGSNDRGFGVLVGGGYEFSKHYQVGGALSFGQTSEPGYDYDHMHFSILFNAVAF